MYDPFAQPPAPGTVHTMVDPVPTVSGPLSPNNALAHTMPGMLGRFGGDMARMGPGGMMRAPQGPMQSPGVQAIWQQRPDHDAFALAKQGAPDDAARLVIQQDFQNQMDQWHANVRTALGQFHQQDWRAGGPPQQMPPVATPGGGGTGVPPTGQFPLNPGAPPTNDWRTMRTPKPSYGI